MWEAPLASLFFKESELANGTNGGRIMQGVHIGLYVLLALIIFYSFVGSIASNVAIKDLPDLRRNVTENSAHINAISDRVGRLEEKKETDRRIDRMLPKQNGNN